MGPIIKYKGLEINYDGKLLRTPHWRCGYCRVVDGTTYIGDDGLEHPVDPKTVGQFTGLLDSNDKEVYGGDIFEITANPYIYNEKVETKVRFTVIWNDKEACFDAQVYSIDPSKKWPACYGLTIGDIHNITDFFNDQDSAEIIGNIHQEEHYGVK